MKALGVDCEEQQITCRSCGRRKWARDYLQSPIARKCNLCHARAVKLKLQRGQNGPIELEGPAYWLTRRL